MTEPTQKPKKISRRDAIKLLGAVTGATVLANLPSKWSTPEIAKGVLPAHAQTSTFPFTHLCGPSDTSIFTDTGSVGFVFNRSSSVSILPSDSGIIMNYNVTISPATGTASLISSTNGSIAISSGSASIPVDIQITGSGTYQQYTNISAGYATVTWTFNDPTQGTGSCDQTLTYWLYATS